MVLNNNENPLAILAYSLAFLFKSLHKRVQPFSYGKGEYAFESLSITLFMLASWSVVGGTPGYMIYFMAVQILANIFAVMELSPVIPNSLMFGVLFFFIDGLPKMSGVIPSINLFALIYPPLVVMVPTIAGTILKKGYQEYHIKGTKDEKVFKYLTLPLAILLVTGHYGIIPMIGYIYLLYNAPVEEPTETEDILKKLSEGYDFSQEGRFTSFIPDGKYYYVLFTAKLLEIFKLALFTSNTNVVINGEEVTYNIDFYGYGVASIKYIQSLTRDNGFTLSFEDRDVLDPVSDFKVGWTHNGKIAKIGKYTGNMYWMGGQI